MIIDSLSQIYNAIPAVVDIGGELHSPCPFCKPSKNSRVIKHKNILFVGEDRFFWQENHRQFYCRQCGRHSIEEVTQKLFGNAASVADEFLESLPVVVEKHKELVLYDEAYIEELHKSVVVDYWRRFGWSTDTIERFRLGYGRLYPTKGSLRHIIPFVPRTLHSNAEGMALEGRLETPYRNEPRNMKTAGLTKEYFTEIIEGDSSTAVICEGIKDAITAYQIGYRHIFSFFGNATDLIPFMHYIEEKDYARTILFCHNDEPGQKYLKKLNGATEDTLYSIRWPAGSKEGYDLTNLFEEYGDEAYHYISQNVFALSPEIEKGYIADVRTYLPDYEPPSISNTISKEQVRQELPEVLQEFIDSYEKKRKMAGRGLVKVLAADPGSGKSYALVQMAENLARKALHEFEIERRALDKVVNQLTQERAFIVDPEALRELDLRIRNFKERSENLSCATVLYAGPFITGWQDILDQGADETLWYNYEARNTENCENFHAVSQLASKGYVPMAYCQSVCPLKSFCEKTGYLSQEAKRKAKPITYVRHQQLMTAMVNEYKYIIIDENCLSVFDTPIIVDASQLKPTYEYWDSHMDMVQVKLILELVEGVRQALLKANEYQVYSGREVMRLIDEQMLGNLVSTLRMIDIKAILDFQPKTVMQGIDTTTVPIRCLPTLYQVLLSEIDLYESKTQRYNSGLHIVNQELEVYSLDRIHIPSNRPIIVSDGTPLPDLYGLLFDREVELYAPSLYSSAAQTIVYSGSDFTITSIRKQLKGAIEQFNHWLKDNDKTVTDIFGDDFDLSTIPFDENIYNSSVMRRALTLIKMTAEKHESLLFVTYKPIRAILEKRIKELYPDLYKKIHFAHYWSLRGTNRFKDVEAVLLLGCPRVPYDKLYRRIQAWGKISRNTWITPDIQLRITPYYGELRYDGYTHPNYEDNFARNFVDMVEAGEIRQSLERIRQHTSNTPKYAYLAMSRPAAKWVTTVDRVGEVTNNYDNDNFRLAYQEMLNSYLTENEFPSYTKITKKYHLSNTKIASIKRSILNGAAATS